MKNKWVKFIALALVACVLVFAVEPFYCQDGVEEDSCVCVCCDAGHNFYSTQPVSISPVLTQSSLHLSPHLPPLCRTLEPPFHPPKTV